MTLGNKEQKHFQKIVLMHKEKFLAKREDQFKGEWF